ncbi:Kdo hydroxylase family protein [Xenorhabdus szentirmaii]|uniref:3-deoxy-D-manno-oct-2-ulosonic acid (Kdo) hydroxylase n=2 Tax=Xenorhabdus szentirmaii TaxID=290112 RepID=W1J4Q4_9GAMM|nr:MULTISPECIES: Kdo hydroxylase family protein [Xenorhabdus]MBD2781435.1 Kdo hydroxylase family protein [Xenorhabdus sp. 38]MBD2791825.1 Kdo hydroxylase family protein [Xenorhabdus sp. CUL]MBD2801351.1 Kdo hydroxylase family protein [Xenorhabdus sp. M]MBD2803733.1 Kdo hydroxylase family protein [Xenorhabdus sp. ZM]MBD2821122.1 Kdo hydroxylase family protein [Xenorhabdus sp. 42]
MAGHQLEFDEVIETLLLHSWSENVPQSVQQNALISLELGKVLYLPELSFSLEQEEQMLLREDTVEAGRKNISYRPDGRKITGVALQANEQPVHALLQRYYQYCQQLIEHLLPAYASTLHSPVNSLRVHPITTWKAGNSWRKDDSRLHVDAFPSRPIQGQRILRIFTNINPEGKPRVWRVGDKFPKIADQFLPATRSYSRLNSWLQHQLGITKSRRTHYDHLMLGLHDAMKANQEYQQQGAQLEVQFPAGSTWICYSDQTPHAAMSGQFMLEQTYLLPISGMISPENSPLMVLKNKLDKELL